MNVPIENLYKLRPSSVWTAIASDNFAFWMCCCYLFFEYVRPQAIWSVFDVYPYWGRTFVVLAFLGWVQDPKRKFIWTKITTGIFIFTVLIILSSMNAYWPDVSWEKFMVFFNWVPIYFILTQNITTRCRFYLLILIFIIASFKLSFYGARTFAMRGFAFEGWGLAGPQGFFQNPGELAIQMVIFAPISLFFIQGIKNHLSKWKACLLYLMPVTAYITVIGTNTRGGQIGMAVQIISLITMTKHRIKTLIVIVLIGYASYNLIPEEQKARFEGAGKDETSIQRILYWKHGWKMIKDHPFLGVGYYNFSPYYKIHHSDDIVLEILHGTTAQLPHNIFIQVGTDTGFTGLFVFGGLMAASFYLMCKIGKEAEKVNDMFVKNITKGMNLALLGYIVGGQFVTIGYYPFFWIHLVFTTGISTFWGIECKALLSKTDQN